MIARLFKPFTAVAVLAGFAAASPRAAAEFVTLKYDHATSNPTITSNLQANAPAGPFYWTENNLPPNTSFPPPTATFCIELAPGQNLPAPGANTIFDVRTLAAAPTIGSTDKAAAITELYGRFYDTAWGSNSFTGSDQSVAFQIALWELLYDGANPANTTSLNGGAFNINGTFAQKALAQTWLNALDGDTSLFDSRLGGLELVALVAPGGPGAKSQDNIQDQIALRPRGVVPAPPGLILAGIGLVSLLGRARFMRKPAA